MDPRPTLRDLIQITPLCVREKVGYARDELIREKKKEIVIDTCLFALPGSESPVLLCHKFNRQDFRDHLLSADKFPFVKYYMDNLKEAPWSPFVKEYLEKNFIFFILLVFYAVNTSFLDIYINRLLPHPLKIKRYSLKYESLFNPYDLETCVSIFTKTIRSIWQKQFMGTNSHAFVQECCRFYKELELLTLYLEDQTHLDAENKLGWIPSHWMKKYQKRLVLVSYMKNSTQIFKLLRSGPYPRFNVIDRERTEKKIPHQLLEELLEYIPEPTGKNTIQGVKKLDELNKTLYHSEFTRLKCTASLIELYQPSLQKPYTVKELFQQAIVLSMVNWEELWARFQFKRSTQIVRRLYFLVERMSFSLDPTFVINFLFTLS